MRRIFSDEQTVQKWLDFEAALARVEARLGVIPQAAADEIIRKARVELFDLDEMKREMDRTSHPIVPMLRTIKKICDGNAGEFVHWGATTQDVTDTGTMLQLREALEEIGNGVRALHGNLRNLSKKYRDSVIVARSHGQHALPTTFGFKTAVWTAEIERHMQRMAEMRTRLLVGQFSGAVGTLAAISDKGVEVQQALMEELGLGCPEIAWHTARDRIGELVCVLAMLVSSVGKIAHEIYCLQRTEISELEEPFAEGKVGSSTMPHKRNPPTCETIVALARIIRATAPLALEAIGAEHERDKVVLQTEREFVARACCMTDAAIKKAVFVTAGLTVRTDKMESNLSIQKGLLMSEAIMMDLGDRIGRQEAHEVIYRICMEAFDTDTPFRDLLVKNKLVRESLTEDQLDALLDPSAYTGLAGHFVDQVLANGSSGGSKDQVKVAHTA
jgi:adenylosuccinate lyase